jgi:hypothetical protein
MKKIVLPLFIFLCLVTPIFSASAITGTIDPVNKYCWGRNLGWINFGCTNCGVQVSDTTITGYAWSRDYGWINLNPTNGGVHNTIAGVLSGYAWGKNAGWINFDGVTINSSGQFRGTALGDVAGTVNFSCTEVGCPVTTDWRPSQICGDAVCNGTETCANCPADCGGCSRKHNECNAQKQCVSVNGNGANTCANNNDCDACDPHGDINKDGSINIVDFSILMYFWDATPPSNPCADLNKDGTVNLTDFSIMLYWWTG